MRLEIADVGHEPFQLGRRNVRRIGRHEVKPPPRQGRPEVALPGGYPHAHPQCVGVAAGHGERVGREVDGVDGDRRTLGGEGDRDAPRARAEVGRGGRREVVGQGLQGQLDEALGLGPRHEHARVDGEAPTVEIPAPDDVRHGLALPTAGDEAAEGRQLGVGQGLLVAEVQVEAAQPEGVGEENLCVEAGRIEAATGEVLRGPGQHAPEGPGGHRVAPGESRGRARRSSSIGVAYSMVAERAPNWDDPGCGEGASPDTTRGVTIRWSA